MPRIAKLDLNQVNKQIDLIDQLHERVSQLETMMQNVQFQTSQLDYVHARPTFNNITFTWTGSTGTISWNKGWIRDKNSLTVDTGQAYSAGSSFKLNGAPQPAVTQTIAVLAGSISSLSASSYYWMAWNVSNATMYALTDITKLYTQTNMQIICQVYTGTSGQSGTAGGGGQAGGTDLSGARYKLF